MLRPGQEFAVCSVLPVEDRNCKCVTQLGDRKVLYVAHRVAVTPAMYVGEFKKKIGNILLLLINKLKKSADMYLLNISAYLFYHNISTVNIGLPLLGTLSTRIEIQKNK